jgi:hypothetical protein
MTTNKGENIMTKQQQNTEKTWEDFYAIWWNEELEFEGPLWQDLNPIVVIIDKLEERKGYEDSEYSIELKEQLEAMKKEFLEKWN